MQNDVLISVVLPTYNGARYVKEAVDSILKQNVRFELVVFDDCSTDETVDIIAQIKDDRISLNRSVNNLGIFGNLNRCIGEAKGDLIQIFSQDDVMRPGYLESQARILLQNTSVGLVYNSATWIDKDGKIIGDQNDDRTPALISSLLYRWIASHYSALPSSISSVMFKASLIDAVGPFDPQYKVAGDVEFYNRVSEKFMLARNKESLHFVRSHSEMTSAISSSGIRYLVEEAALCRWYKQQWAADDWSKVQRFRSEIRGTLHLKWMLRKLAKGHFGDVVTALKAFSSAYALHYSALALVRQVLDRSYVPVPYLQAPEGAQVGKGQS